MSNNIHTIRQMVMRCMHDIRQQHAATRILNTEEYLTL